MKHLHLLALAGLPLAAGAYLGSGQSNDPSYVVDKYFAYHSALLHDIELTKPKIVKRVVDGKLIEDKLPPTFGMGRLIPPVEWHPFSATPTGEETPHMRRRTEADRVRRGWILQAYLVGNLTEPITVEENRTVSILEFGSSGPIQAATDLARKSIRAGKDLEEDRQGWRLVSRRVAFESKACFSCHTKSKVGDTAAILVYALKPIKPDKP